MISMIDETRLLDLLKNLTSFDEGTKSKVDSNLKESKSIHRRIKTERMERFEMLQKFKTQG